MNLQENISRIKEVMGLISEDQAVIKITKPLAFLSPKYQYQIVPHSKTKEEKIYIKKGASGNKTISTKNIEVLKVFQDDEKEKMNKFLDSLRDKEVVNEDVDGKTYTLRRVKPEDIEWACKEAIKWINHRYEGEGFSGYDFTKFEKLVLNLMIDELHPQLSDGDFEWPFQEVMDFIKKLCSKKIHQEYKKLKGDISKKGEKEKIRVTEDMKVDDWGRLHDEDTKILYPYKKIGKFVDWFQKEWGDYANKQGWAIFDSDTEVPNTKYKHVPDNKYHSYYQVQKLDSPEEGEALFGKLKDDYKADELAKRIGLMVDEFGVVIGWDGESFL